MSPTLIMVTFKPAGGRTVGLSALEHLVDVASKIRTILDDRPLYDSVRLTRDGATVEFAIRFPRDPVYGTRNLALGLAGRAISEAGLSGQLVAVDD